MKKIITLAILMVASVSVFAQNVTTLTDGNAMPETYTISLRAPDINDNTFPVPVPYYDDLVAKKSKLLATLDVPLTLSVSNSRARRLLVVYAQEGSISNFPYGEELKNIRQIKLNNYKDSATGNDVLTEFIGPNKRIVRAMENGGEYEIDFTLSITVPYFFDGYVTVAIGSSNGTHLTEICEVNNESCMTPVTFRIVPREITYAVTTDDVSNYDRTTPLGTLTIADTNVSWDVHLNNKSVSIADHNSLPFTQELAYSIVKKSPHLTTDAKSEVWAENIDLYGVYPYMSNEKYKTADSLIFTNLIRRPDISAKTNK